MAGNQGNFVPMAGPVRTVFEVLESLVDFTCGHECNHRTVLGAVDCAKCGHVTEPNGDVVCTKVSLAGLENAAVRIVDMIERGELK